MFTYDQIGHVIIMAGTLLLMPGPTNTLLLFSGATSGFIKTQKLILAELIGYLIAISFWGYTLYTLSAHMPGLLTTIKLLSAAYLLFLSRKIWTFQQADIDAARINPSNVLFTTLCNPKAFVLAAYILPQETFRNLSVYPFSMLMFFLVMIPASLIWCSAGHFLYVNDKRSSLFSPVLFYRAASVILCFFSLSVLYNTLAER